MNLSAAIYFFVFFWLSNFVRLTCHKKSYVTPKKEMYSFKKGNKPVSKGVDISQIEAVEVV